MHFRGDHKKSIVSYLVFILMAVLLSYFITRFIDLRGHNLFKLKSWIAYKTLTDQYFPSIMGGKEFMLQRQSVAGEKLNLDSWFGYQDVLHIEELKNIKSVTVNFRLPLPESYLWIYLSCYKEICWAYRVSRGENTRSGLFKLNQIGHVLHKEYSNEIFNSENYIFEYNHDNHAIMLNNKKILGFNSEAFFTHLVRFQGGLKPAEVNSIKLQFKNSQEDKTLDFSASFFTALFLVSVIIFLAINLTVVIWCKAEFKFHVLMIEFVVLALFALAGFFDKYFDSYIYHKDVKISNEEKQNLSQWSTQKMWFSPFADIQKNYSETELHDAFYIKSGEKTEIIKEVTDLKFSTNSLRIIFLGGSQTWGVGASSIERTWPKLLVDKIANGHKGIAIEAFNLAYSGAQIADFKSRLVDSDKLNADLVIVHTGANDGGSEEKIFIEKLTEVVRYLKQKNSVVLLGHDAISSEFTKKLPDTFRFLNKVVNNENVESYDLNLYLKENLTNDKALLWQDHLHFRDAGHEIAANYFASLPSVQRLAKEKLLKTKK